MCTRFTYSMCNSFIFLPHFHKSNAVFFSLFSLVFLSVNSINYIIHENELLGRKVPWGLSMWVQERCHSKIHYLFIAMHTLLKKNHHRIMTRIRFTMVQWIEYTAIHLPLVDYYYYYYLALQILKAKWKTVCLN